MGIRRTVRHGTDAIPNLIYTILRGVVLGCILSALTNFEHISCFLSSTVVIGKVRKVEENRKNKERRIIPEIPDDYRDNLAKPFEPISAERNVLLRPQKVIDYLSEAKNNQYYIVFIIPVSPRDVRKRFYSRMSWTLIYEIEGKRIGYFYIAGKGPNDACDGLLAKENKLYGDILQVNLDTSPKNFSSLAILAGYQWSLSEIGARSTFYAIVAGDIFVDIANMYEYLAEIQSKDALDVFHCGYHWTEAHLKPRNPASPYYVPDDVYKNDAYPSYCNSDAVITSHRLAQKFYHIARYTKLGAMPNDGAHLWGILREKLRGDGSENLVHANDFASNEKFMPLCYQLEVPNAQVSKEECDRHWNDVKNRFLLEEEKREENDAIPRRKAKLSEIPITDEVHSPKHNMQQFIWKWAMAGVHPQGVAYV